MHFYFNGNFRRVWRVEKSDIIKNLFVQAIEALNLIPVESDNVSTLRIDDWRLLDHFNNNWGVNAFGTASLLILSVNTSSTT